MNEFNQQELHPQVFEEDHLKTILQEFQKDGFVILKDVFSKNYIEALYSEFISDYKSIFLNEKWDNPGENKILVNGSAIKRGNRRYQFSIEVKGSFNSPNLYANPLILPFLKKLFNVPFVISDLTCVTSLPRAKKMAIHRDGVIFEGNPLAHLLPSHAIGLLIPLVSFTRLNGPTRYWPGSHRQSYTLNYEHDQNFIEPEVKIGSCILMDHRLIHSGNPNQSDQIRPLLYCNYSLPWYFDSNNFESQTHLIVDDKNYELIDNKYKPLFQRRNMKLQ